MLMKTVIVTGCCGFIGSNLAEKLLDSGDYHVIGVDDLSNGHIEFLPKGIEFIQACFSSKRVKNTIRKRHIDTVYHLAALPRVSYSVKYPLKTNDINVTCSLELLEACKANVGRVVFASSSSVYGGARLLPTSENYLKDPKSPYALQKSIIEDYLKLYNELYELDSVSLRFFNVFGKHQISGDAYATAISSWLNAIKNGKPMRSDGDGTQSRDMCHVDNVTHACVLAGEHQEKLAAEVFNVACGDRTTNNDILQHLMKRYSYTNKIDAPWRPGDVMHTQADIDKIRNKLGYKVQVRVWEGIEKTCDWYDANWPMIRSMEQGV